MDRTIKSTVVAGVLSSKTARRESGDGESRRKATPLQVIEISERHDSATMTGASNSVIHDSEFALALFRLPYDTSIESAFVYIYYIRISYMVSSYV